MNRWAQVSAIALMTGLLLSTAVPASAGPNCTCRYKGQNYEIGEVRCILGKLQRCEMALNNTSWKVMADICPMAQDRPAEPAWSTASLTPKGNR